MSVHDRRPAPVRLLPSSRPAARTWLPASRPGAGGGAAPDAGVVVPAARPAPGRVVASGRAWGARAPDDLPDAARWSGWFAVAAGEALLGHRPASRLVGWVSAEVLANLARRQRLHPAEDLAARTVLLSGRVQHPRGGVAEASAVLQAGPRLLVLAFRLEATEGRWVCTALEAGLPPRRGRRSRPRAGAALSPGGSAAG